MLYSRILAENSAQFYFPEAHHHSVSVTGNFCGWHSPGVALQRTQHGWSTKIEGVSNEALAYKFIVDGRWITDPINLARVSDGCGGFNSYLPITEQRYSAHHFRFWVPSLGEERGYVIAIPSRNNKPLPTLYLLHGALDWERTWIEKGGLLDTANSLLERTSIEPMLLVMPAENGALYKNDRRVLDYLARDLVGHIDFEFQTKATPTQRAIDGLSTGGFTSLQVGLRMPHVFRSIGTMSGSHDQRSFDAVREQAESARQTAQHFLVSCGLQEPHLEDSKALLRALQAHKLDATWEQAPGIHDWPVWKTLLGAHLQFHSQQFRNG